MTAVPVGVRALRRWLVPLAALLSACSVPAGRPPASPPAAESLVLITIDTLRADHVGAYGYAAARTPSLDRLAREGVRFERAYTPAPITLTAHASLLTGLYPPGHGARHNGMPAAADAVTLAAALKARGFSTAAFVAAFPLDRRFGLARGFDVYSDRMPRGPDGRQANERPGREVVDEAIAWAATARGRVFLWVHLFEPHAPYGDPARGGTPVERYDAEIATADAQVGRLLDALAPRLASTLVVLAGDHGEAFGEHGELGHSLFVYDTTLRVPLILAEAGLDRGRVVGDPVCLVDVAPTVMRLLGLPPLPGDGADLGPALSGGPVARRALYAESFAPLLDFGWSPLRSIRDGGLKAIAAPRPELFDVERDPGEERDLAGGARPEFPRLLERVDRISPSVLPPRSADERLDHDARARLAALGYLQGAAAAPADRPDPKDRRDLARRIARVTSGEAQGAELLSLLQALARDDPRNGQVQLRLGHALVEAGRVREAEGRFSAAISAGLPSADPYLGLALCLAARGATGPALATLAAADRVEPGNAVVQANIGLLETRAGRAADGMSALRRALDLDPDLHEARFNLALSYARAGRRHEAAAEATELLRRLPSSAPQRPEVERLLAALR
jgi:arylsulfatase A-like enzyme/thioredoxin-like negative regulator of GroEL